ncbi:hypothetical protein [Flavihumibacter petaseus]|uniref:DUF5007 domain-containing protein n=1 Tax=Flavihumibacter petaseus NBRC 106054 TaxID=1220578 RepID=A0A0E9MX29_9BACT|nr:hypothetical protein [Flavihumibacter petaseus]GAO42144.1 hypothetical protein FPE01S_01_11570 [Flavihumibacter petaseus NBRC 106054]
MSQKLLRYTVLAGVLLGTITGCKKLPDGFLSPGIRYEEDPILIQKGRTKVSSALNLDGSSKPTTVRMVHIYDDAGKLVDDIFSQETTIKGWTALYDPKTDTTLELIAAKQTDMVVTPIMINPSSGQVEANFTTLNVPPGKYHFDLEISNGAGQQLYPKLGHIQLNDGKPYDAHPEIGTPYTRMVKVGDESKATNLFTPIVEINRVGESPNVVVVKMMDKNGVPFNPRAGEINRRPNGATYLQTLQDYALKTELFDDRMEFTYGVIPFPLTSLGNGFNIYYRIPGQFVKHDNAATYPEGEYSANPRFVFRAFVPGKYEILFKMPDITHR